MMNWQKELLKVRTVVSHANCPDGTVSMALVSWALDPWALDLGGSELKFIQYGQAQEELAATPGLLFVDMTPPRARVQEFVDAGAIVLDHHAHQRDVVEAFGERGVYSDEPGVSGALLAFRHVVRTMMTPAISLERSKYLEHAEDFAVLAGIWDTWQRQHPRWEEACIQAEALRFFPFEEVVCGLVVPTSMDRMMDTGRMLLERRNASAKRSAEDAYRATIMLGDRPTRLAIFQGVDTSDAADLLTDADAVVGFHYRAGAQGPYCVLSMRSRGDYDVGAVCKARGGGGHKNAAGCTLKDHLTGLAPYELVTDLFARFGAYGWRSQ